MKTRTQIIDDAYQALYDAYSKAFGDWWLNASMKTSSWAFEITEYQSEELIRSTDGYVELRIEQVKAIGRNSWKYIVFQVFPEDVGPDYEFYDARSASNKFMELQLQMKLAE
jgi:hypothetical protein